MNSSEFFRTLSKFRKQRENHRPVFSSIKRELLGIFTSAVTTKKCTKSVMQVDRKCMQSCCLANYECIDFLTFSLPSSSCLWLRKLSIRNWAIRTLGMRLDYKRFRPLDKGNLLSNYVLDAFK